MIGSNKGIFSINIFNFQNTFRDQMFSKEIELSEVFPEHLPLMFAKSSVQRNLKIISYNVCFVLFLLHKPKFIDLQTGYSPDKIFKDLGFFIKPPKIMVNTSS